MSTAVFSKEGRRCGTEPDVISKKVRFKNVVTYVRIDTRAAVKEEENLTKQLQVSLY